MVQPLEIVMDPRSSATPGVLAQQFQLSQQMFLAVTQGRQGLAEIMAMQKKVSAARQNLAKASAELQLGVAQVQDEMQKILKGSGETFGDSIGLEQAVLGVGGALGVAESGDRAVPSQGIEVFEEFDRALKQRLEEWSRLKTSRLPQLNDQLKQANMAPLAIDEIGPDDGDSSSQ